MVLEKNKEITEIKNKSQAMDTWQIRKLTLHDTWYYSGDTVNEI